MTEVTANLALTGVLTLTLNRPAVRNAFDPALVRSLQHQLLAAAGDNHVRAVVLIGAGRDFCAGGDIVWMRAVLQMAESEMRAAASEIALMLETAYSLPKPLIATVHGAAMGGGLGLACCADIVLADERAKFGLGEVRLGIIPALISPYLVRAIGHRKASAMGLLAEPIDAGEALQMGIVTQVCPEGTLSASAKSLVSSLLKGGPEAQRRTKSLLRRASADWSIEDATALCVSEIVAAWQASEAGEGMQAFLEKRPPRWDDLTRSKAGTC